MRRGAALLIASSGSIASAFASPACGPRGPDRSANAHAASCRPVLSGEIALAEAPACGFFVVVVGSSFSLVRWIGGRDVFVEGDAVSGPLLSPGLARIALPDWNDRAEVLVEEAGVSLSYAQKRFFERCGPWLRRTSG